MVRKDTVKDLVDLIKEDIGRISNITRKGEWSREDDDEIFRLAEDMEDYSRRLQKLV